MEDLNFSYLNLFIYQKRFRLEIKSLHENFKRIFFPLQQSNLLILIGTCQESYFLRLFLFINSVQNLLDEIAYGV